MADIFTVIADPTRREILGHLLDRGTSHGESSVSEIVDALGVAQPTISKHLKTLRDAGLVHVREDGQHRYYSIDVAPLDEVDDWLMPFVFADDESHEDGSLGAAAFAAWAGTNVTTPLRSAAEQAKHAAEQARAKAERARESIGQVVQDPAPLGESLGRRAAEAAHDVQGRIHEAQERASHVLDSAKGRLRGARGADDDALE